MIFYDKETKKFYLKNFGINQTRLLLSSDIGYKLYEDMIFHCGNEDSFQIIDIRNMRHDLPIGNQQR